jgi:hypothetical protein
LHRCRFGLRGLPSCRRAFLRRGPQRPPCPWCVLGEALLSKHLSGSFGVSPTPKRSSWSREPDRCLYAVASASGRLSWDCAAPPPTYSPVLAPLAPKSSRINRPRGFSPPRRLSHSRAVGLLHPTAGHGVRRVSPLTPAPPAEADGCVMSVLAALLSPRRTYVCESRSASLRPDCLLEVVRRSRHGRDRITASPSSSRLYSLAFAGSVPSVALRSHHPCPSWAYGPSEVPSRPLLRARNRSLSLGHDVAIVRSVCHHTEPITAPRCRDVGPDPCSRARVGSSPRWMPSHPPASCLYAEACSAGEVCPGGGFHQSRMCTEMLIRSWWTSMGFVTSKNVPKKRSLRCHRASTYGLYRVDY